MWRAIYEPDDGGEWACLDFSSQEPRWITAYAEKCGFPSGRVAAEKCRTDPNWDNHSMMAEMIDPTTQDVQPGRVFLLRRRQVGEDDLGWDKQRCTSNT